MYKLHKKAEKNSIVLLLFILITVSIGGLVEIVPLFYIESTIEKVEGMRPYTPLEQMGRNIYIREGCYLCHSQMIRPFRDEEERYGHYSLAAESMYDHPFQWGSKRTGPDLARVGGRYSNEWHVAHMQDPRHLVPESVMPAYPFLAENKLKYDDIQEHIRTLQMVQRESIEYTDEQVANAKADLEAQVDPYGEAEELTARYPKAVVANFDGNEAYISELDALLAYLQMLGTLVDLNTYQEGK
jgi:cytochrome c oxidase cbb3-type subunit 2